MKLSSVRLRLTLWNSGILALILFAFLIATHIAIRSYLMTSMDHRLQRLAERQSRMFERFDPSRLRPATDDSSRRRAGEGEEASRRRGAGRFQRMTRLFDMAGKPIAPDGSPSTIATEGPWDRAAFERAAAGVTTLSTVPDEEASLRVLTVPYRRDGRQIGIMQVAGSFAEMQDLLDSLTWIQLLLVPCAVLLAIVSGLFLTNRALKPVSQIARAAEGMNPEDLSQRLPVIGNDEFAHLAITINGMLARLAAAFARLTESVARERRFTADASHELRTPLTAIKANTGLALRGERTPEQYRESLQAINQAAESMHRLVQDLLLLARSDSGQLALQCQPVDTEMLLHEAVEMTNHQDGQAPVAITVAPDTPAITGDPHHLQRLLVNLLDNALRHTPPSGAITLTAEGRGREVVITVADTGEGIPTEHLSHLGERFYRIDEARARQHGGTGLGLAICRSIVDAHHGTLAFASTPGDGTTVTVTLPAA